MLKTHIGSYEIIREIAAGGGIGQSFEAFDRARCKRVILSSFPPETVTEKVLTRLRSEAKTFALLNHPTIARVFGFIHCDDRVYLVTEFIEGHTLETILKERSKMPVAMAVALFRQIMAGLTFAHRLGVVHGNLEPVNIVVPNDGPVKILNFAIAHVLGRPGTSGARYVSPEQIEGAPADARSDIYSLGTMLYEAIVGKGPFDAYRAGEAAKIQSQLIPVPPSLMVSDAPEWLDEFLLRMLAPSPANRFQSVKATARFLEAQFERSERGWRPLGVWRGNFLLAARGWVLSLEASMAGTTAAFGHLSLRSKRQLDSFKQRLSDRVKPDWRSYAQVAALLVLVLAESFYFGGVNIRSLMNAAMQSIKPKSSLNDSVDSMFARINQEQLKTADRPIAKKAAATVVERQSPSRPLVEKPRTLPSLVLPSESAPRAPATPIHRAPSAAASIETVARDARPIEEPSVTEPVRTVQNDAVKADLRVKWEN
jgi:serine/threonine protein kinase